MQWTGAAEKVRLYINTAKKTMTQIKAETGCDIIINGGLFSGSYKPVCHLKADGKVLAKDQYTYFGYGWNDDGKLKLVSDYSGFQNYICCVCLVRNGKKEPLYCDAGVKGARPRTAIGTMPNGYLWVYISANPATPEALQDTAMLYGVLDAVMLDGGGSTRGILPAGSLIVDKDRICHNYICIWKKEGTATVTAPTIKQKLSHSGNYGDPATGAHVARSASAIRFLVLHYTGNDGDSDEGNGNYFHNNKVKASCHYFVDDDSITQSVPDSQIAWHCGGKVYYHPNARNANSIGIELCDNKKDGTIYPSQATIDRALNLVRWLMQCYKIPAENVIRHWDVSHKLCPAFWCGTAQKDALWRSQFWSNLNTEEKEVIPVTERRFQTLVEIEKDAPWAADTIEKLIQRDILQGTGTGLDLSRDMLRLLVINDRAGAYDK